MPTSTRRQLFVASPAFEALYEGSKTFWKTRTNLEILILSHAKHNCLEVIAFDPEKGVEAPPIYLDSVLLHSKLDQNKIQLKVEEKKEALIRQKKAADVVQIRKEIVVNGMNQFIISRLQIVDSDDSSSLHIHLAPMGEDVINEVTKELDVIIPMPIGLEGVTTCFQKKVTTNEIQAALDQLEAENAKLKLATYLAELGTSSVDGFKLMLAEKMRLENEMKQKFSVPRLRWIKAINRVLAQNYVEKVRVRLAQEVIAPKETPPPAGRRKPKVFRHSMDNNLSNKTTLHPDINETTHHLPEIYAPESVIMHPHPHQPQPVTLPVLSPTTNPIHEFGPLEKRRRRTGREGKLERRSFESLPSVRGQLSFTPSDATPSLIDSYTSISQIIPRASINMSRRGTRVLSAKL
eukprot:CAMPEP_0173136304 /NCGR_PEP_ID=MMETSP1105-20130129/2407_1 /TAXON_ID=2985 /ORGANISM="Ochromonas sp., Strain BG-1" /LENGTH=405 /DNA_ID=CAMNT_0014048467 /DNA_START=21 /DNA_END=1238 /DNA_ORIENTATION=-